MVHLWIRFQWSTAVHWWLVDNSVSQVMSHNNYYTQNYAIIHYILLLVDGFCSYESFISPDDRGIYNWTETAVSNPPVHTLGCAYEPQDLIKGGMARRACISNNTWVHPEDRSQLYDGIQCITNSTYQLRLISRVRSRKFLLWYFQTSLHALL